MSRRPAVTDDELNAAQEVIRRYYREWVDSSAADLIRRVYQERWVERTDDLREAVAQIADDAMTYTRDQYVTIFASDSHDDALDALRETGADAIPENFPAPWAYYAFEFDLNNIIQGADMLEPYRDGLDPDEQVAWLLENHGKCFYRKTRGDYRYEAWFIGITGENTREEVDFGVLLHVTDDDGDGDEIEWVSTSRLFKGESATNNKDPDNLRFRSELPVAWDAFQSLGAGDPQFVDPAPEEE